jgi:hypothetical protein
MQSHNRFVAAQPTAKFALVMLMFGMIAWGQSSNSGRTCSVRGVISDTQTGGLVVGANVYLRAPGQPTTVHTVSDKAGRFCLAASRGQYRLSVESRGYVPTEYGARKLGAPGTTLSVGTETLDLQVRLDRAGVIEGHVLDADDAPVSGVKVQALQEEVPGKGKWSEMGEATTDKSGHYMLTDLIPGHYVVGAICRPNTCRIRNHQNARQSGNGVYANTYYPNARDILSAVPIQVAAGQDAEQVNISLNPVLAFRIKGKVLTEPITTKDRPVLTLVPRNTVEIFSGLRKSLVVDDGGTFEISDVIPGSYTLLADQEAAFAEQSIDVIDQDVDVTLAMTPNVDLAGSVVADGEEHIALNRLTIFIQSVQTMTVLSSAKVNEKGKFTFLNLRPDTYIIRVIGLPSDWYIRSIETTTGNFEPDSPVELSANASGSELAIRLEPNGGQVAGVVTDNDQKPIVAATVALIRKSAGQRETKRTTTTDQYGHFLLRGIPPGEYRVFASDAPIPGSSRPTEESNGSDADGEPISVGQSSRVSVTLKSTIDDN